MASNGLDSGSTYADETFKKVDFKQKIVTESTFTDCKFVRCDFSETAFQRCRFVKCQFEDCTMKMTKVEDTTFFRVAFRKCNLLGVNWTESTRLESSAKMSFVEFEGCILQYAIFFGLELKKMKMKDCEAREVNFAEADLTEADFAGTELEGAVFLRTDVSKANFVGAKNYSLNIRDCKSRGAKFAFPEVMRLLYALDIVLIDPTTNETIEEQDVNRFK